MTTNLMTYFIVADSGDKLKKAAKTACNFWNRFISPDIPTVVRLGTFFSNSAVIARAYRPYISQNVRYNLIEFNTKYLNQYSDFQISGTLTHEMGHTLGFGWDKWMTLFDIRTGAFKRPYTTKISDLTYMFVELDYGPGTEYSHWDEERFDQELMTGIKDSYEYVLPVTIKVMKLLGHTINEQLPNKTSLESLLRTAQSVVFSRAADIENINLEHFEETELMEEVFKKGGKK
jgi:hypothetical protein